MGVAFGVGGAAGPAGAPLGIGMGIGMVLIYLIMAVLYIIPGVYLTRYASKINTLMQAPSSSALEDALVAQKSFWKFVGISVLVLVGVYVLLIIIGIVYVILGAVAVGQ